MMITLLFPVIFDTHRTDHSADQYKGTVTILEATEQIQHFVPEAPQARSVDYYFQIPSLSRDTDLSFYLVHQYCSVYVEDELLYECSPADNTIPSKTLGSLWVQLPLCREDAGKQLRVEITPVYHSSIDLPVEFFLGQDLDVYAYTLKQDLLQLILGIAVILIGLIFSGLAAYSICIYGKGRSLLYLGISSVLVGLWRILDTRFMPMLFPEHTLLMYNVALCSLNFITPFLIRSIASHFNARSRTTINRFSLLVFGLTILLLLLQLCGGWDLRESLPVAHTMMIAGVLVFGEHLLYDFVNFIDKWKSNPVSMVSIVFIFGVLMDLWSFYSQKNTSHLLFTLLAFLIYILVIGSYTVISFVSAEQKLAEKEAQLTRSRITAMSGQIKAHFIFNILNAISGMCKYDPVKADETIVRFSRFLRTNINILQDDSLVPFEQAMKYVDDYIALEKVRFGEGILFETDIQVMDFMLPPLALQPLVENAIKHGFSIKNYCGTILLKTWQDDKQIYISVRDDGVGFNIDEAEKIESIGLQNVRFRLKHLTGGTLQIESAVGKGTIATITIPKNIL